MSDNDTNSDIHLQAYRNNRNTHAYTRNNNNYPPAQRPGLAPGPGINQRQGMAQGQGLVKGQGQMAPSYQQQYLQPSHDNHQVSDEMNAL